MRARVATARCRVTVFVLPLPEGALHACYSSAFGTAHEFLLVLSPCTATTDKSVNRCAVLLPAGTVVRSVSTVIAGAFSIEQNTK